jgi:aerobic-type carbon monoxide dehydrogenase small subunit (CoxS/CutS family)
MTPPLDIIVNGARHRTDAAPDTPLLYVLRNELALGGPKFGCGLGQCGACTVHLGGTAVRSCVTPVSAAAQLPVTTIEGLGTPDAPHPLQRAFIDEQAAQCGYCITGMIMTASALLARTPHPSDTELRSALAGNLCRCGTHLRILHAIRRVAAPAGADQE